MVKRLPIRAGLKRHHNSGKIVVEVAPELKHYFKAILGAKGRTAVEVLEPMILKFVKANRHLIRELLGEGKRKDTK